MNRQKTSDKNQTNNSLVASLAFFVDYYHPRYIVLENVASFTETKGKSKCFHKLYLLIALIYNLLYISVSPLDRMLVRIRLSNSVEICFSRANWLIGCTQQ
jgi:hypothetical protein